MFNTLYFLYLNNYYNRTISVNWSLGLYLENVVQQTTGVNFNPNDGVNTELITNMNDNETPNYLVVCDENNNIKSKWFIVDSNRIRGGQYKYTLRRDVISDYWNIIKQSPCLIEKCSLNYDDKLIFNNEDMTFNQIKTSETLLKDKSDCAWLVGYLAKGQSYAGSIAYNSFSDLEILPLESWGEYEQYSSLSSSPATFYGDYNELKYQIYYGGAPDGHLNIDHLDPRNIKFYDQDEGNGSTLSLNTGKLSRAQIQNGIYNGFKDVMNDLFNAAPAYTPNRNVNENLFEFLSLNGRYVQDGVGKVYKAKIVEVEASKDFYYNVPAGSLYNLLSSAVSNSKYISYGVEVKSFNGTPNQNSFRLRANYTGYQIELTEEVALETSYNISATGRLTTADAAYDIIAIPYGEIKIAGEGLSAPFTTNQELGIKAITSISVNETNQKVYDIQLVPYCPVPDLIVNKGEMVVTSAAQYSTIKAGDNVVGIIFNVPSETFTNNIEYTIPAANSNIQRKINNECDKWRLCSPNYSNYFDFSVEKNGGVQYFNVDCTYKPFNPYIHVNPNFNNLYGQDFNDPRGLICGGDFSLTQVTDNWQAYQVQNKNFQASFDRQIQNIEVNNKYQKITDIGSAIAGTLQGTTSGLATGLFMSDGNPIAAGVGAAVGTVTSATAGIADVLINEKLRNEALDYTRDMFGYNLGNIQALPLTLSKISAFNANNKIFPVLEYYTATDREKEALANKVAYNGMTTMVIGTIEDNTGNDWEITINDHTITSKNYIKARLIRIDLDDDFHIANTIAKELNMGFYIDEEE